MLLTPQVIEKAATDIVGFWEESELPDTDKAKILEMVQNYYEDRNEHLVDQYLRALCERTINTRVPQTGFEANDRQ